MSFSATLPKILSPRVSTISSFFLSAVTSIPLRVPQSNSLTTTSCETSCNLRVRYPASAVFSAVSASPFLAPCVEMKYSKIERPSLKFDSIGFSIISPPPTLDFFGLAIKPLIPVNCLICSFEPLAPESSII